MKSENTTFKKLTTCFFIALAAIGIQSCETEIPVTDTTIPEFSFQITGDGFYRTFDQDTDFEGFYLQLRRNTTYNFIFAASDEGGVKTIDWSIGLDQDVSIHSPVPSPWILTSSTRLEWFGNRSDPRTGSVVSGNFSTNGSTSGYPIFHFYVEDFGGQRGVPNFIGRNLNISLGDTTEWIEVR